MQHRALAPLVPGMHVPGTQVPGRHGPGSASAELSTAAKTNPLKSHELYTHEQRLRRDRSPWTLVQGVLAPIQFLVFLVSLVLVLRYLTTGSGLDLAKQSVFAKTMVLYLIMITGAIWEKEVFGQYLFAPMFWWEDFVSMGVIALHTIYLAIAYYNVFSPAGQLAVALAAYASYVINAAQFLYKLRLARLGAAAEPAVLTAAQSRRAAP